MPTTSNFGWTTPADTDLVKDGAAAIRTLGNGVDASLVDLKGGTTGQILSKASNTDLDYTWIANDQGDITEVQAGTGISVASGTGPIPVVTNSMATEITAKGDLIVGTGSGTFDNLPAGTNGHILVADSGETTGLKWAAATSSEPVSFWARQASSQSFTASTWTKIDFGTELFDSDNYFASSRFTPLKAGYYDLTADLSFEGSGSGFNILAIYKNGATHRVINRYNTDGNCVISASGMVFLDGSTDYAEIYAYSTRTTPSIGIADSNGFNGTFIHS